MKYDRNNDCYTAESLADLNGWDILSITVYKPGVDRYIIRQGRTMRTVFATFPRTVPETREFTDAIQLALSQVPADELFADLIATQNVRLERMWPGSAHHLECGLMSIEVHTKVIVEGRSVRRVYSLLDKKLCLVAVHMLD